MEINHNTLIEQGREEIVEFKGSEFEITSYTKEYVVNGISFYIEIRPLSNTVNRDWHAHIDNCDFESVASLDVSTFEQIDELIKLCI